MIKEKQHQLGALKLQVKSHPRKYKHTISGKDTPIYSAQSPFDESRFRLKSIIPNKFAKFFTDRIYFMMCNKIPVFVDIWSGQRVLEVIPLVEPMIDISRTFTYIPETEFVQMWEDMEILGIEKRLLLSDEGKSVEWTLFYTDTAMTKGIGQGVESSHLVFAKF